ncbi:MAG: TolC family protein [Rikenellaceae bacterium]
MNRAFLTLALLVGVLSTSVVQAQSNKKELTLTLDEAVQLALSDNPTIKVAELEVERYDYVRKATFGSLLPQLSVDGVLHHTIKNQSVAKGFSLGSDGYNTISATANLTVPLYVPAVYRALKLNTTQAEAAVESARSSKIDMVAAVKDGFYNVLIAQKSLEVLEESAQMAQKTVNDTEVMFDNGIVAEYDLLTAQVQYSNLQPTIIQTRSAIDIAKQVMKMYLSLPEQVELTVVGDLDDIYAQVAHDINNLSTDISNNTSMRSLELNRQMLQQQLRISNSSRLPTLAAYGSLALSGNNTDMSSFTGIVSNGYFWQTPSSVGLSLSVPIFAGFTNTNNARSIKNQIAQLDANTLYTEESLSVSVSSAISNIHTAGQTLVAQQTTAAQAHKAYEISLSRYNAGAGTILELNSSQLSMTQAELNLSQAMYDLLTAKSEYDRIIGVEE